MIDPKSSEIRIPYRQGVEIVYAFRSGRWIEERLATGVLKESAPLLLPDVLAKLQRWPHLVRQAMEIDPQGVAALPPEHPRLRV